jgi:hypothetical protein
VFGWRVEDGDSSVTFLTDFLASGSPIFEGNAGEVNIACNLFSLRKDKYFCFGESSTVNTGIWL